jgi:hypothetical protein
VCNSRFGLLLVLALVALWASGCSDLVDATQPDNSLGLGSPVIATQDVGQTFVARHGGLNGISVSCAVDGPAGDGMAVLHLRTDPTLDHDIAQASLPLDQVSSPGFYRFSFPPIRETHGRRYYFVIEAQGLPEGSSLTVGRGPGRAYDDGAMYRSGQPRDRQLTFQLHYAWVELVAGALLDVLADLWVLVITLALFVLPGWALVTYLLPGERLVWSVTLGLAAGLSLCLYPLVLLWARVIGVQPGAAAVWGPVAASVIALGWRYHRVIRVLPTAAYTKVGHWIRSAAFLPDVLFALVALLVLGVRLFAIHGYQVPFWGDSVQHAVIGQLIVDHGGLFDSWLPYTPFQTFTVHFGFHSDIAVVHWLMGDSIPRNTLVTGQIVNFFAILTLVPLANRLFRSPWAGVGALLVAGVLSPMPMEYVNWGRYSQLAGQAVLPVAAWLTWRLAETQAGRWRTVLLTAIALAGMFLSYYRMPHYYAAFVVAWLVAYALPRWRLDWRPWCRGGLQIAAAGLAMLVLLAPWLAHIASSNLAASVEAGVATGSTWDETRLEYEQWRDIALYVPPFLMILAGGGMVWGLTRRGHGAGVAAISLWAVGLAALTATRLIRLPGSDQMTSYAIVIGMYMPVGLLGGYLIDSVLHGLGRRGTWVKLVSIGAVVVMAVWGIRERGAVIKHAYRMVAPADLAAMDWIRANTQGDAVFLVDGFLIYNGYSIVGSDAGWWIPLLAGRQNTMPPQYALLSEEPSQPDYPQLVTNLVMQLRQVGVTSPQGMRLLCQYGVTHVYVGQGRGRIALPPPRPMLPIGELESSPHFDVLYRQDKVGVFAFDTQVCPTLDGG